jgi:hypothetical protein
VPNYPLGQEPQQTRLKCTFFKGSAVMKQQNESTRAAPARFPLKNTGIPMRLPLGEAPNPEAVRLMLLRNALYHHHVPLGGYT